MSKAHEIVRTGMRLAEFFRRFPDDRAAEVWFVSRRWPSGPVCPHCGGGRVSEVASRRPMPYRCRECRKHFSVMSHTLMHASKLGAQTWLLAIFLIVANPKGRSSVQLAADLGVTQKTAWHLAHRIRQALAEGGLPGFDGPVEADETYIGGKARNRHAHKARSGQDRRDRCQRPPHRHCRRHTGARGHHRHSDRDGCRHHPPGCGGLHRRQPHLRPTRGDGLQPCSGHPRPRRVRPRFGVHQRRRELLEPVGSAPTSAPTTTCQTTICTATSRNTRSATTAATGTSSTR